MPGNNAKRKRTYSSSSSSSGRPAAASSQPLSEDMEVDERQSVLDTDALLISFLARFVVAVQSDADIRDALIARFDQHLSKTDIEAYFAEQTNVVGVDPYSAGMDLWLSKDSDRGKIAALTGENEFIPPKIKNQVSAYIEDLDASSTASQDIPISAASSSAALSTINEIIFYSIYFQIVPELRNKVEKDNIPLDAFGDPLPLEQARVLDEVRRFISNILNPFLHILLHTSAKESFTFPLTKDHPFVERLNLVLKRIRNTSLYQRDEYELCETPFFGKKAPPDGVIYIEKEEGGLKYSVKLPNGGRVVNGFLDIKMPGRITSNKLEELKTQILDGIANNQHIKKQFHYSGNLNFDVLSRLLKDADTRYKYIYKKTRVQDNKSDSSHENELKISLINNDFMDILLFLKDKKIIDIDDRAILNCFDIVLEESPDKKKNHRALCQFFSQHLSLGTQCGSYRKYDITINTCGNKYHDDIMRAFFDTLKQMEVLKNRLDCHFSEEEVTQHARVSMLDVRRPANRPRSLSTHEDVQTVPFWLTNGQAQNARKLLTLAAIEQKPMVVRYLSYVTSFLPEFQESKLFEAIQQGRTIADFIDAFNLQTKIEGQEESQPAQRSIEELRADIGHKTRLHQVAQKNLDDVSKGLELEILNLEDLLNNSQQDIDDVREYESDEEEQKKLISHYEARVKTFSEEIADVKQQLNHLKTELMQASQALTFAQEKLSRLQDVSKQTVLSYTLLHMAVIYNRLDVVDFLIRQGADVSCTTKEPETDRPYNALHLAAMFGHREMVRFLLGQKGVNPLTRAKEYNVLELAAMHGQLDIVKELIAQKMDVTICLLHVAIQYGQTAVVKYLLNHMEFDNLNEKGNVGLSAVHIAARYDQPEALKLLLAKSAIKINAKSRADKHSTPLSIAIEYGHVELAAILLQHGADPCIASSNGFTALHWAINGEHQQFIDVLLKRSDIRKLIIRDPSIIRLAASKNNITVIDKAVDLGVRPTAFAAENIHGKHYFSLLHEAVSGNAVETVARLIRGGANCKELVNQDLRTTLLHLAVANENAAIVKLLIDGARAQERIQQSRTKKGTTSAEETTRDDWDIDETILDRLGRALLDINANKNETAYLETVNCLIDSLPNINVKYNGLYLWEHAMRGYEPDVLIMLLDKNMDVNLSKNVDLSNAQGETLSECLLSYLVYPSVVVAIKKHIIANPTSWHHVPTDILVALVRSDIDVRLKLADNRTLIEHLNDHIDERNADAIRDHMERNPSYWMDTAYYCSLPQYERQTFVRQNHGLSTVQDVGNQVILHHLLENKLHAYTGTAFGTLVPSDAMFEDVVAQLSHQLAEKHICLNPQLLSEQHYQAAALNDLFMLLEASLKIQGQEHNIANAQANSQINKIVNRGYVELEGTLKVANYNDKDNFYHATLINIIHACLSGGIEKNNPLWQNIETQVLQPLRDNGRLHYQDEDDPKNIIIALLHDFNEKPVNNNEAAVIAGCNWIALQQSCLPYLKQWMQGDLSGHGDLGDAKEALRTTFIEYICSQPMCAHLIGVGGDEIELLRAKVSLRGFIPPQTWQDLLPRFAQQAANLIPGRDEDDRRAWLDSLPHVFDAWWIEHGEVEHISKQRQAMAERLGCQLRFLDLDTGQMLQPVGEGLPLTYGYDATNEHHYHARLTINETATRIQTVCDKQMVNVDDYRRDLSLNVRLVDTRDNVDPTTNSDAAPDPEALLSAPDAMESEASQSSWLQAIWQHLRAYFVNNQAPVTAAPSQVNTEALAPAKEAIIEKTPMELQESKASARKRVLDDAEPSQPPSQKRKTAANASLLSAAAGKTLPPELSHNGSALFGHPHPAIDVASFFQTPLKLGTHAEMQQAATAYWYGAVSEEPLKHLTSTGSVNIKSETVTPPVVADKQTHTLLQVAVKHANHDVSDDITVLMDKNQVARTQTLSAEHGDIRDRAQALAELAKQKHLNYLGTDAGKLSFVCVEKVEGNVLQAPAKLAVCVETLLAQKILPAMEETVWHGLFNHLQQTDKAKLAKIGQTLERMLTDATAIKAQDKQSYQLPFFRQHSMPIQALQESAHRAACAA